jgi:Spy/CpxP family protein refolding chaperone
MNRANLLGLGALLAGLLVTTSSGMAQGAGGGQGRGRGNFDPEEMRARIAERMKEQLKATEAEWKVIQPLLENVMAKQREATMGRFGGMAGFAGRGGGPGGPGGGDDNQRRPRGQAASAETEALDQALGSESSSTADIKAKLASVREARKKAEAELKKAREELRQVLTLKQEARLVLMGTLD